MPPLHVGYLTTDAHQSAEDEAALDGLRPDGALRLHPVPLADPFPAGQFDVWWLHRPDAPARLTPDEREGLRRYVETGGTLLLTGFAALLPHALGAESRRPAVRDRAMADAGFGRGVGFQTLRGHPLFDAFHGGVILSFADADHTARRVGYFDADWPEQGRVVAVERSYITLHTDCRLVVEHTMGGGRILSVGAHVRFGGTNHRALHTRRFVAAALHELARPTTGARATYWTPGTNVPQAVTPPPALPLVPAPPAPFDGPDAGLRLTRAPATDAFFDVAGRRCLMMGAEHGGLTEAWVYPFRVLRDLDVGLVMPEGERSLRDLPAHVAIRPEALTRTYAVPGGTLKETIVAARDAPGGLIRLHAETTGRLSLIVRYRCDLRWMWPYPEDTLGALHYGYDDALHALHVHDPSGDVYVLVGTDRPPEDRLGGVFEHVDWRDGALHGVPAARNQVTQALRFTLEAGGTSTLHLALVGTDRGAAEAEATYRSLLEHPGAVYREAAAHGIRLQETCTTVTGPDPVFNAGYRWALVGTDRFQATTPGLGIGLLAGYATSDAGWDGGHADSGRPGYAWYFGRDAAWAALAVAAYGDTDLVRHQLTLFRDFQDVSGKIFHELPASGPVHYDAADATPLYVILAAQFARTSGDLDTIRRLAPSLRRAMDFLYATDTDGDGLIENTNVGHGWIEGGPLFGAHATLYLSGLWAQALHEAAYLADLLGDADRAERYAADARRVHDVIDSRFWDAGRAFYGQGLRRDGTVTPEPTVLASVLMLFGQVPPARAAMMLDALGGNDFATDWGLRLIGARSPLFNAQSYHGGTVWPLFTGWTALAAYACGRSTQGFTHLMQNLLLFRHHTLGFTDEVLHGDTFTPRRVCPHQCWSETAVLHPALAGLVGAHPDAPRRTLRLEPRPPLHWDTLDVENLHVGATRLRLTMRREQTHTRYALTRTEGPPVTVRLAPELPPGVQLQAVQINGTSCPPGTRGANGLLTPALEFSLHGETYVDLHHTGGIGVLAYVPNPVPGATSEGFRVIRDEMHDGVYTVTVEGPAGTTGRFFVRTFDRPFTHMAGAIPEPATDDGITPCAVSFDTADTSFVRTTLRFRVD